MAVTQYRMTSSIAEHLILERPHRFGTKVSDRNRLTNVLEEEIFQLRLRMERVIQEHKLLTSQNVLEISSILDEKINAYMKHRMKS